MFLCAEGKASGEATEQPQLILLLAGVVLGSLEFNSLAKLVNSQLVCLPTSWGP